jgi:predicted house-cleaning noncanonical NTP pyrophosphatase (MazG superfamily)
MRVKMIRDNMVFEQRDGERVQFVNSLPGKQALLLLKLHEEADEISRDATDPVEYADLIEVMMELARINGVSWSVVEEARQKKFEERGGFRRGRIWIKDESELEPWPP